jgi:hypothetical protein
MPRLRPDILADVKIARRGELVMVCANRKSILLKSSQVDWSKVKPNCKACSATGISGWRGVDVDGKKFDVGNVCDCVLKRGGIKPPSEPTLQ